MTALETPQIQLAEPEDIDRLTELTERLGCELFWIENGNPDIMDWAIIPEPDRVVARPFNEVEAILKAKAKDARAGLPRPANSPLAKADPARVGRLDELTERLGCELLCIINWHGEVMNWAILPDYGVGVVARPFDEIEQMLEEMVKQRAAAMTDAAGAQKADR